MLFSDFTLPKTLIYGSIPAVFGFLKYKKYLFVGLKKFLPTIFLQDEVRFCWKAFAFREFAQNTGNKGGERNRRQVRILSP